MTRYRKYTITWKCDRCHVDAREEQIFCAREDCRAIHLFMVRCVECDQRVRFRYDNHAETIAGRDVTISRVSALPPELH